MPGVRTHVQGHPSSQSRVPARLHFWHFAALFSVSYPKDRGTERALAAAQYKCNSERKTMPSNV